MSLRVHLLVAALLFVSPLAPPAPAQVSSPPPVRVTGVVLDDTSNMPVARCSLTVRLESEAASNQRRTSSAGDLFAAQTDAQGRFAVDLPGPGRWQLTASAAGYRPQFLNEHEAFSSALILHAGVPPPVLTVHLARDSSISGVVRDEAGEPIRNANLSLELADPSEVPRNILRVSTDDRGFYEISGISPGAYHLSVLATPWYASAAGSGRPALFDVVYPLTWYPNTIDPETAGRLSIAAGETQEINFNLLPLPAAHLRLPASPELRVNRGMLPSVERIGGGAGGFFFGSVANVSAAGQVEFGNLPPGLYRVTTPQPNGQSTTAFVRVGAGAEVSLPAADGSSIADLTIRLLGGEDPLRSDVVLTDVTSGAIFSSSAGPARGLRRRPPAQPVHAADDTTQPVLHVAVPPGRYVVTLAGDPDLFLVSLDLKGKRSPDRLLTVTAGPADVQLTVARGRARVSGHVTHTGQLAEGAMVLLVPTTFGQPGATDRLRRDQSNTDGSFELEGVIPGDYILIAVDHGWQTNWRDPATLARYLAAGIPLTLEPHGDRREELSAQNP